MWRSIVIARIASLSRHTRPRVSNFRSNLLFPPQAPRNKTLFFTSFSSPIVSSYPIRRLFSQDSSNSVVCEAEISNTASPDFELTETDGFTDTNNVFDEMPSSCSSESVKELASSSSSSMFAETSESLTTIDELVVEKEIREVDSEELESVLSLLQSSTVVGSLKSSLENLGLTVHEEFVVRVLETPLVPGENLIGFYEWVTKKPEISVTTRVVDALVRAICRELRIRDAYALWDLLKEVGEKENCVLNTEILNESICLFSRVGAGKAGFEVFNKFGEFGCVPNEDSFYFTIEALSRGKLFDWAGSVCEKMINEGKLPGSEKIGKIISYLCKGNKAKDAHMVYSKVKDRCPPKTSVNFLISSLCRKDESVHLALEMLEDFRGKDRKYAIKPFSSVIQGLCRIKDVERAKELLFKMIAAGPPPGNAVFNSIVNSLSKAGDMEEAMRLMKVMESRGLKPDLYTYSVIMSGYAKGGEMEEACKVLAEAKKKHSKLCPVTYHTLIRGYCKLEQFDKALELLSEMKEYGVQPNVDEYNKLIQSLCLKASDWETAEKLLEEMKANDLHLSGITKGLIRAIKELEEEDLETQDASIEA